MQRGKLNKVIVTISKNKLISLIVAITIVVCGSLPTIISHADTASTATAETESGTLNSPASTITDSSASGGQALMFQSGSGSSTSQTLHYAANNTSQWDFAASLGFNLLEVVGSPTNPTGVNSTVNSLPTGTKALVWVGNLDNSSCTPRFTYDQFTAQVDALKNNSRVFAYYLSDEPHPSNCPSAVSDIKARADYIHANAPGQKSFMVLVNSYNICGGVDGCEYAALNPSHTDVDYIGLDPYPCHYASDGVTPVPCSGSGVMGDINSAIANGIPVSAIVPVYQTFGQYGRIDGGTVHYRMPTASELTDMINTWHSLVPNPAFDYAYTFGTQCSTSSCQAPQAVTNTPDIQTVMAAHNAQ